ncbi:MAG: hypothetical protein R3E83_06630 [Burkholderiaceae bacterium]
MAAARVVESGSEIVIEAVIVAAGSFSVTASGAPSMAASAGASLTAVIAMSLVVMFEGSAPSLTENEIVRVSVDGSSERF